MIHLCYEAGVKTTQAGRQVRYSLQGNRAVMCLGRLIVPCKGICRLYFPPNFFRSRLVQQLTSTALRARPFKAEPH